MSKTKSKSSPVAASAKTRDAKPKDAKNTQGRNSSQQNVANDPQKGARATRETVESIVIAIVLAFLFRGFEAEAFVIPTGSMAPTLQGRHVDVSCQQCGYGYRAGASCENPESDNPGMIVATTCPVCRYTMTLNRKSRLNPDSDPNQESFTGDRILVSKFAFDFTDPKRWDVVVFKYPGDPEQNYIKRLVGLPGETVIVRHGDIHVIPPGQTQQQIARKSIDKVEATLQLVDDNQFIPGSLVDYGWASRWQPMVREKNQWRNLSPNGQPKNQLWRLPQSEKGAKSIANKSTEGGWRQVLELKNDAQPRVWRQQFAYAAKGELATQEVWLRYRHVFPTGRQWTMIAGEETDDDDDFFDEDPHSHAASGDQAETGHGRLITDFYAYNAGVQVNDRQFQHHRADNVYHDDRSASQQGSHWVGDLAVECDVEIANDQGGSGDAPAELLLDLVKGGVHYECRISVGQGQDAKNAPGRATLSINGGAEYFHPRQEQSKTVDFPMADTKIRAGGRYRIRFANVNQKLYLWVDDKPVRFDLLTTYDPPATYHPDRGIIPVWAPHDPGDLAPVGVGSRGAAVTVKQMRVLRDVYYTALRDEDSQFGDYLSGFDADLFRSPTRWQDEFPDRNESEFELEKFAHAPERDQFFVLGDNSPQSSDARIWSIRNNPKNKYLPPRYVERRLLTGKALMVYWPHHWRRPIPFLPNFKRMGFIE